MIRRMTFAILGLFLCFSALNAQSSLEGKVTEAETGEPIIFGTIALYRGGNLITGVETDFDGNYIFSNIDPGTYDVEARYLSMQTQRINGVLVQGGKVVRLDFEMKPEGVLVDVVEIIDYKVPLIEIDNTTQGKTITSEEIRNLPTRDVNSVASLASGASSIDGGAVTIRGSRSNATNYYIDGVRVSGNLIPTSEIDQLQVVTGGLEARYGDVTGGVISLTTKGPSQKFSGGVELETSEYLDAFGYNLASANFSGPILKKKVEGKPDVTLLGYRVSAQWNLQKDDGPSAVGVYRLSEDKIAELEATPTILLNGAQFTSAEWLTSEDVGEPLKARPNEQNERLDIVAKLDARLSNAIDISLSGSYSDRSNRFTPGGWDLLNYTNNPYDLNDNYRANFRLRHRLGRQDIDQASREDKAANSSLIRNASYDIQLGYEKAFNSREDLRHEDNLFRYGFFGNQDFTSVPIATFVDTSEWMTSQTVEYLPGLFVDHIDFADDVAIGEFIPSEINSVLAKYQTVNGQLLGATVNMWGNNYYSNVGQVYNLYRKLENDRYTANLNMQFDLLPGGSDKGRHNIQLGFMYEQRIDRAWQIGPRALWQAAGQLANAHFVGVDTTKLTTEEVTFGLPGLPSITLNAFERTYNDLPDNLFYQSVRDLTGQTLNDWVNVNGLNPDDLSLDMFSASELINFGNVGLSYYGYDYLGELLPTSTSFNAFFTERDEAGRRTFPVTANTPIYGAGYVQDKFSFKDIIFRIGMRFDYYDANTKVLPDPYALYPIETAEEFYTRIGEQRPETIEPEYKVYVAEEGSTQVVGYRAGDEWYSPNGTVTEGQLLFPGGLVNPSFRSTDGNGGVISIKDPDFDPETNFVDYEPQLNFMPRISFSFPISEEAGFFAHYDVLVQRPPSNNIFTARDFYFFTEIDRLNPNGAPANNPNLRPEKTIDYEVGFQQKLSQSSALKISAYYREMRDMIQSRFYTFVPFVNRYETYGNLDFGTVKGFSLGYDLRRTGNIQFQATYTLQFAEGTGSAPNSSVVTVNGAPRVLLPLSFDERHRLVASIDYRYGSGKKYNGPRIAGKEILANAGINIQTTAVSGRPYTKLFNPTPFGGSGYTGDINGARLPWNYNIDLRVDKNFRLFAGEQKSGGLSLNVYVRVNNVLNTKNVIGVYPVTGSPENDGYLDSRFGQDRITNVEDTGQNVESFIAAHSWRMLSPGNYTLPRRIIAGLIVNF